MTKSLRSYFVTWVSFAAWSTNSTNFSLKVQFYENNVYLKKKTEGHFQNIFFP